MRNSTWLWAAGAVFAIEPALAQAQVRAENPYFRDADGAAVILRGLNLTADAKVPPFRPIKDEALLDRLPGLGVNVARLLFNWEAFEPERSQYDTGYLDYYAGVIDALHARGIWVIADVHQDAFSRFATDGCGDGMPSWAISPSVVPDVPDNGPNCASWGIKFIVDEDTHRSWDDFYADVGGVRTRYLAMLQALAERIGSHPALIGYDMLNEPWGDEVTQIGPLYEDAARVLRGADPDGVLFVSAQALTSAGQDTLLARPSFDNFAYSPHYYDASIVIAKNWPGGNLEEPLERMHARAQSWNVPLFVGEFGAPADATNVSAYIDSFYAALDARLVSGAQWSLAAEWDPVTKDGWNTEDFSILDDAGELRDNYRIHPYPARISGDPLRLSVSLDPEPVVELDWSHRPELGSTRIFAPRTELFGGDVKVVTGGGLGCAYEADGRHLRCESAEAGEKSVRLERCPPGVQCTSAPPRDDAESGCSCSLLHTASKRAYVFCSLMMLVLARRAFRARRTAREQPAAQRTARPSS